MYHIAICEDEEIHLKDQADLCRTIFRRHGIDSQISVFHNGAALLESYSGKQHPYDLILLDIVMDEGKNGMETAREIRKQDIDVTIIFITSNPDYAIEGYDVRATHYLLKPVDSEVLEKLILSDYNRRYRNQFIILKNNDRKIRVAVSDIISMEIVRRQVEVALVGGLCVFYSGKLSELLEKLPHEQFVRCHQSFGVNIANIRELNRQCATTVDGREIPISRAYLADVQKAFARHMRVS